MKFVVLYRTERLGEETFQEFNTETDARSFVEQHTGNEDFKFRVIEGREIEFKPVRIA